MQAIGASWRKMTVYKVTAAHPDVRSCAAVAAFKIDRVDLYAGFPPQIPGSRHQNFPQMQPFVISVCRQRLPTGVGCQPWKARFKSCARCWRAGQSEQQAHGTGESAPHVKVLQVAGLMLRSETEKV